MPGATTSPRFPVPAGACDCHFHIFGPAALYPPSPGTQHLMPDALPDAHAAMRARVGLERMVLVQVGGYYLDNQPMMDVLAAEGHKARGIAAYQPDISAEEIAQLAGAGVRGMRVSPGRDVNPARLAEVRELLASLGARFAPFGWHIQLLLSGHMRDALLPHLAELPVPVVIDHLGLFRPERIAQDEGLDTRRTGHPDPGTEARRRGNTRSRQSTFRHPHLFSDLRLFGQLRREENNMRSSSVLQRSYFYSSHRHSSGVMITGQL